MIAVFLKHAPKGGIRCHGLSPLIAPSGKTFVISPSAAWWHHALTKLILVEAA
jgi:hypothetical protein